jgi:glycerol-3-phosphate dehydrogenase
LRGALLYYDALTDDSRLVIEVLKSAHALGALVVNYTRLVGLLHEANGELIGGRVSDELTGREFEVRARVIVNATGVWTDEVRALSGQIETAGKRVRPSKGVHLMLAADRLRVMSAWLIPSLTGHRFYFVVPWEGACWLAPLIQITRATRKRRTQKRVKSARSSVR